LADQIEGEFLMVKKDSHTGVSYCLNCKKVVFHDVEATLFLIRGSTDTEKAHRKLVEEKYRGVLLSTITHELKTPLTIISGNLELVRTKCDQEDQAHLEAAMLAAKSLKYYLYDINVPFTLYTLHRT